MKRCPHCDEDVTEWVEEFSGDDAPVNGLALTLALVVLVAIIVWFASGCAATGFHTPRVAIPDSSNRECHVWYIAGSQTQCWRTNYEGDIGYPVSCDVDCPDEERR